MTDIVFNPYRIRFLNGEKLTGQEQDLAMMDGREYLEATSDVSEVFSILPRSLRSLLNDDELVNRVADKVIQKLKEDGLI
tara:strand:- start:1158 stop:1397 length:240 start_codon:yes stop_codon:yes gene_type:complete